MWLTRFFGLAALPLLVSALAPTDETQAADPPQSGYLPYHNIGPDQVTKWVKLKNLNFNVPGESFYGTPLVYTPSGFKNELVVLVSDMNTVRLVDGVTGVLYKTRTLDAPFSALDANCNNEGEVGITGTPFIDSTTSIMYFYAKSYINGQAGPQGTLLGVYKLWALQLPELGDVPGFPVAVTGPSDNDKTRYFVGGTLMQRPGITMIGDSIVAGFGGHCDSMNFTGMLVAVSKTPGKGVTSIYAMEAAPGAPAQGPDWKTAKGGKAGIWQSGMGLATDLDNNRVFFATGNSDSPGELGGPTGPPRSGKNPISTLGQAIVNMGVDPITGLISQQDFFIPSNYVTLNAGDKDVSSSGVSLLDANPFSGGGVNRVAISGSKAGYVYVMDADNLGGFKTGPGGTDGILQTFFFSGKTFYNGVGSYPAEGGWVYICSSSSALQAYKLVFNSKGQPNLQLVAQSVQTHGCHGSPTVTSLNGQPGTAIVWLADTTQGLTAYRAVPDPGSSVLTPITIPGSGGLTKFHRPTFGNNRVYVTTGDSLVFIGGIPGDVSPPSSSSISSSIKSTSTSRLSSSTSSLKVASSTVPSSRSTGLSSAAFSSSTAVPVSTLSTLSTITKSSSRISVSTTWSSSSTKATPTKAGKPPKPITRTLNWNLGWVNAAPDGFSRPMVGINGQWPCPPIVANVGDTIKINVVNNLVNETTAIHFHGLYQFGANSQDGPAHVTQCPIPPGASFVYEFKIQQIGTYWYHAHIGGQYLDGLRGPIIISDFYAPFMYDKQYTMTLADHYHKEAPALVNYYQSPDNYNNYGGTEPVPDSTLINEQQGAKFAVEAGKTYLFNIISMAAYAAHWVQFNSHTITVVEIDGVYTVPFTTQQLYVTTAQRYTVLLTANADPSANYGIISQMNTKMFDTLKFPQDGSYPSFTTAYLVYNSAGSLPGTPRLDPDGWALQPQLFDDTLMVPLDGETTYVNAQGAADFSLEISSGFGPNDAGQFRGFFGGISYVPPKIPSLYTLRAAAANLVENPTIYGTYTQPIVLPFNAVVEITIFNHDSQPHPFHLHGHNFQVINRVGSGDWFPDSPDKSNVGDIPMRRDTILVHPDGATTIRFIANNPGIWLFHCHNEWHVEAGLTLTFIEAPAELKKQSLYIPTSHKKVCDLQSIPMKGNAAANKKNYLDLTGENTTPPLDNWGALLKQFIPTPPPPSGS